MNPIAYKILLCSFILDYIIIDLHFERIFANFLCLICWSCKQRVCDQLTHHPVSSKKRSIFSSLEQNQVRIQLQRQQLPVAIILEFRAQPIWFFQADTDIDNLEIFRPITISLTDTLTTKFCHYFSINLTLKASLIPLPRLLQTQVALQYYSIKKQTKNTTIWQSIVKSDRVCSKK